MRRTMMIALAAATAACGGEATQPQDQPAANQAATAGSSQRQILALPEPQRLAVFRNAIADAGQDCQQVDSAAQAGSYRGLPVWRATCRGGSVWTIVIADNGGAQILNAAEAQLVTDQAGNAVGNGH